MDTIRQYVLSVICGAILCGLMHMLLPEGTTGKVTQLIIGLVMTLTVLSPLFRDQIFRWDLSLDHWLMESENAVLAGQTLGEAEYKKHIQQNTEAYILDKAAAWDADITVNIDLCEDYPYEVDLVRIHGSVSPYVKMSMLQILRTDLGLTEDNLLWSS